MTAQIDIHSLAGAYVLDAVDDLERAAFDRHLRQCSACAIEVAELRETTARLGNAAAVAPPPWLRDSVLAAIARTPQERPTRAVREPVATTRWRRWTAASAAAAIMAVGIGVTTWTVTDRQARQERQLNAQVQSVLGAPDVRLATTSTSGGQVTVLISPSRDNAVAVLDGLADPGDKRVYQLWMIDGSEFRHVGLLDSGSGTRYIDQLGGAQTFAVSREPAGGSKTPTLPAVVTIDLSR
jgi:anti-sigma-K factor RskA